MKKIGKKGTLLIDVDGTLARYNGDWEMPIGDPLPGAVETMKRLSEQYTLLIFTTRSALEAKEWLIKHGIPFDGFAEKPLNFLIIDDRTLRFNGNWDTLEAEIKQYKPWWRKEDGRKT